MSGRFEDPTVIFTYIIIRIVQGGSLGNFEKSEIGEPRSSKMNSRCFIFTATRTDRARPSTNCDNRHHKYHNIRNYCNFVSIISIIHHLIYSNGTLRSTSRMGRCSLLRKSNCRLLHLRSNRSSTHMVILHEKRSDEATKKQV